MARDRKEYSAKRYAANAVGNREKARIYRQAHPDADKAYRLDHAEEIADQRRFKRHGFSRDQFISLLVQQGGRCAICRTDQPGGRFNVWHIDHDHACCSGSKGSCGRCVRGLLCAPCNIGLGSFRDNPENLEAAADYLRSGA